MVFALGYGLARKLRLSYADAAPAAMIGASNHFEVAIATATMLFGLSSGAALATVVGVLIEVPVMLMLVKICTSTRHWFKDVLNGMTMPEAPADIMNRLETLQQQVNQLACQGQTEIRRVNDYPVRCDNPNDSPGSRTNPGFRPP